MAEAMTEGSRGAHLPSLEEVLVADAMRPEVLTCPPEAPLRTVARMMDAEHVHCIVTSAEGDAGNGDRGWGVVSDLDLMGVAGRDLDEHSAAWAAVSEFLTVSPDEKLDRAVQIMVEHEATHLIVVEPASGRPVGVLSTLDVAGVLAVAGPYRN
jgi:CBS domain-containing protein